MNDTAIRWTSKSWNPVSGCVKVGPGCKHCYAETLAENKRGTAAFPKGFDLTVRPHKLKEPFRIKEPSLIFVNSMSDLFWDQITDAYRDEVLDVIEATPQHQYQVLTKRHETLRRYSERRRLPSNFWAGVSGENDEWLQKRGAELLKVRAEIRFLSLEPALSRMDVAKLVAGRDNRVGGDGISWVIYGGESGNHLSNPETMTKRGLVERAADGRWVPREDRLPWARAVRDDCAAHGVSFFFKQHGGPRSTSGGHELDGDTWEEFPRLPTAAVAAPAPAGKRGQVSLPVVP